MSEDIFRTIVAVGVVLAGIAFVVQACVVFAIYRVTRKVQEKTEALIGRVDPLIGKVGPTLDKAGPVIEKIGPVIEEVHPLILKAGVAFEGAPAVIAKIETAVTNVGALVERATILTGSANQVVITANNIMKDARPQIVDMSAEAAAIVRTGREQVERVGELIQDAGAVARNRIQQIDNAVTSTVDQVEHAGEAVKSAVMRPVREVSGLAAGISAAVSTLVRGQRKSSVDAATQDEEMFI
jgi:hypothetical protein